MSLDIITEFHHYIHVYFKFIQHPVQSTVLLYTEHFVSPSSSTSSETVPCGQLWQMIVPYMISQMYAYIQAALPVT